MHGFVRFLGRPTQLESVMRSSRRLLAGLSLLAIAATANILVSGSAAAGVDFGYGSPTFVNSAAPSDIDQGLFLNAEFAGEPSVGVNWNTGAGMYQASNSTYKLSFDNSATPPAVTWSDASSPFSQFNIDPISATNPVTGTTIAGGDDGACGVMSITHDDGESWTPTAPCPIAPDHPTVGFGAFHEPKPLDAVADEVGYFCQQPVLNAGPDICSYTHDGGLTWRESVPDTAGTCHSLFGHVKISPDGTAYVPNANCTDASGKAVVGGLRSDDSGLTLTGYTIPGATTPARGFDPSVATASNNRVYQSWSRNDDYHPVVSWSDDHGATWAPTVDLATTVSPALSAATFEAAVAGDGDRAAVAYLGTWGGAAGKTPFDDGYAGVWYLFVSYTFDGGASWQTVQATPEPVQRGSIDDGGTGTTGQRNLLDFMDAALTKEGRVLVGYADGCLAACNAGGTSADSQAAYATVAYQASGRGLFAAYDAVAPVAAPSSPSLTSSVDTTSGNVGLSWAVADDGGSAVTRYDVLRGLTPGTEAPYATTSASTYADSAVTAGATYYYQVVAHNAAGASPASNEVSATPTTLPGAPTLTATSGKNAVTLSWTKPSDGGTRITGWDIYRGTSSGTETLLQSISTGTTYTDGSLSGGTKYFYVVRARNANGAGAASNEASATPKGAKRN